MEKAALKIQEVYQSLGQPEKFKMQFYDVPHQFNVEMQDDAFAWLERWLRGTDGPKSMEAGPR
jgi:hypothetical protein